ncbi:hypothetical protein [Sphingomonas sp. LaA6.9]|uniref:hypothetical protein n=1 Tax=Sphingomonas sp. LaA6.9 TaxID=2919914 RepID=UPI001F4FC331|nr:hypothetical protein [Sphingomonas sp. LaA6.9]MCJ8157716.1 hypothetical protein [Sphingomonas sp. LaA6.9]
MSRDQRPGRVRVFTSGQTAEAPYRRRGDVDTQDRTGDEEALSAPKPPQMVIEASTPKSLSSMALAMLFVVGCGVGGMLIAALGLFEVPR